MNAPDTRPLIERQAEAWMNRAGTIGRAAERVNRDPCLKCGTRGDVGCKHRRGE